MRYNFEYTKDGEVLSGYAEFDFDVTYGGAPESGPSYYSGGEPAEPLEYDIIKIEFFDSDGNPLDPSLYSQSEIEEKIQSDSSIYEAICAYNSED